MLHMMAVVELCCGPLIKDLLMPQAVELSVPVFKDRTCFCRTDI